MYRETVVGVRLCPDQRGPRESTLSRYVGRVGALAVALGIGGAVTALSPIAWADETGGVRSSGDSQHSSPAGPTSRRNDSTGRPKREGPSTPVKRQARATPRPVAPRQAARAAASVTAPVAFAAPLGPGPTAPMGPPVLSEVLAWARRQFGVPSISRSGVPGVAHSAAALPAHAEGEDHPGLPDDLERTTLVDGLNEPTDFRFLPDGTILISEKTGAIKVYQNGQLNDTPLITLTTRNDVERGLAGLVVDPDFATNHYIYVSYTAADNHEQLTRLTVTGYTGDPTTETLSAGSEHVLYRVSDEAANYHQGGGMQFGPDGKLYWGLGDNFDFSNSQSLSTPHGKILRLDVRNLNPDGTASAPADNPFVNTPGALPEIYAYGLRNPFRFVFAPTGELLEADVGGAAWEEINVITAGANYGWPLAEGSCSSCAFVNPLYVYAHTGPPSYAGAISSILVYTGDALGAEYTGKVFIADYAQQWLKDLSFDSQYSSFIGANMFDDAGGTTVQLLEGPDGNLYQLTIYPGTLSVIATAGGNRAPTAVITATPPNGYSPLTVGFSSVGSKDPEDASLTYSWDFGDPNSATDISADPNPTWTYTANGSYTVTLTVSDGEKTDQTTQKIVVGSTAPTVTITSPVNESKYDAGDKISFSGVANDAEDGTLPDSAYKWTVEFHHADHIHPFADNIIGPSGSITIPTDESNVNTTWYRVILTVTDSSGLSSSSYVDVKPNLVNLTFTSTDPEAVYTIDGIPHKGTYTEQAVVGVKRIVNVPSPQTTSDGNIVFGDWSDGGAQTHTITTPGTDTTYTVVFDDASPHPVPDPLSVVRQLVNNELDGLVRIANAMQKASSPLFDTVGGLPIALLGAINEAVANPAEAADILNGLSHDVVAGLAQAAAPLVNALTDVVATTALRTTAAGAVMTANLVPITAAMVNAPVAIVSAVLDSAGLVLKYLLSVDKLGVESALKYAPESIGGEIAAQTANLETAINDLRYGLLGALSIGLPDEVTDSPISDENALLPLEVSLARTAQIAKVVGASAGNIGQVTGAGLQTTLNAAGTGLQNFVTATLSGRDPRSAAIVAWSGLERKAGVGRRGVQDAVEGVQDAL
ncbi:PKD domain containing protein [Mycolicibacterium rhodesiae JS60]|nr:PKD domain containing protein [Mycolicibacterium rhodesiae JS60]